jgi:hypothetical protein
MTEPSPGRILLAPDPNSLSTRQRLQQPGYPGHRSLPITLNQYQPAMAASCQDLLERAPA